MRHKIIVRITPEGETQVEVDGMKGGKCSDVTKQVEKALGTVKTDKKKNVYFQVDGQGQHIGGAN